MTRVLKTWKQIGKDSCGMVFASPSTSHACRLMSDFKAGTVRVTTNDLLVP